MVALAVWSTGGSKGKSTASACTADVRNVQTAQQAFFDQVGSYAPTTSALAEAGLLKTEPPDGEVVITLSIGPPASVSVVGAPASTCAGFVG